ncbi:MAG: hypothetical protein LBR16_04300 [Treponema sp.]|nr:hypothetical protein [Treponema sp.]
MRKRKPPAPYAPRGSSRRRASMIWFSAESAGASTHAMQPGRFSVSARRPSQEAS